MRIQKVVRGFPIAVLVAGICCAATGAWASASEVDGREIPRQRSEGAQLQDWLSDGDIAKAFAGRTIAGHYADGRTFEETYEAGGRVDYRERGGTIGRGAAGHWSVVAGSLCTIYENDPTGGCYRVRQTSSNCFEFYFIARSESDAAALGEDHPAWTARGWIETAPSTCKDDALV